MLELAASCSLKGQHRPHAEGVVPWGGTESRCRRIATLGPDGDCVCDQHSELKHVFLSGGPEKNTQFKLRVMSPKPRRMLRVNVQQKLRDVAWILRQKRLEDSLGIRSVRYANRCVYARTVTTGSPMMTWFENQAAVGTILRALKEREDRTPPRGELITVLPDARLTPAHKLNNVRPAEISADVHNNVRPTWHTSRPFEGAGFCPTKNVTISANEAQSDVRGLPSIP